jgi:hypothetical protein
VDEVTYTTKLADKVDVAKNGTKVVVRPGSTSELGPTLEFQIKQGKGGVSYEIRYGD